MGSVLVALCQLAPTATSAQVSAESRTATASQAPAKALEHYNRGRAHYLAGRYRQALQELEVAVNLDPTSPNLVYNVARVYELLGDIDQAIAFYRRYRDMLPAKEQAERERTVTTLQRLEGARAHAAANPPPKPVVIERKRGVADGVFWGVASMSALTLAGGGATGALALKMERDAERFRLGVDGGPHGRDLLVQRADRLALASDVLLISGASLGIAAILLYALRERPLREPTAGARLDLSVQAWSGGGLFSLRGPL